MKQTVIEDDQVDDIITNSSIMNNQIFPSVEELL